MRGLARRLAAQTLSQILFFGLCAPPTQSVAQPQRCTLHRGGSQGFEFLELRVAAHNNERVARTNHGIGRGIEEKRSFHRFHTKNDDVHLLADGGVP
jgi:hypothetical protein